MIVLMLVDSDVDLLRRWRDGEKEAGNELFSRHFASIRRFFRNKVGNDDAEDLIQRSMLECVKSAASFRGASSFRTFLFVIARRELWQHIRRRARETGRREPDLTVSSVADLGLSPSRVVAAGELQTLVAEAMRRIPVDFQITLELHYWEQMSGPELAEVLDISPTTVRTRLHRAREALRAMLREQPGREPSDDELDDSITTLNALL